MTTVPDIGFRYRASPTLAVALLAIALLAAFAVASSGAPLWLRTALIVLTAALAGLSAGRLWRPRVRSVLWRGDGSAELTLNDSVLDNRREARGEVRGGRVLGPLLVLTLRWPGRGRASLWLLPDNLDADSRRRLRVRLGTPVARPASGNADSG